MKENNLGAHLQEKEMWGCLALMLDSLAAASAPAALGGRPLGAADLREVKALWEAACGKGAEAPDGGSD